MDAADRIPADLEGFTAAEAVEAEAKIDRAFADLNVDNALIGGEAAKVSQ